MSITETESDHEAAPMSLAEIARAAGLPPSRALKLMRVRAILPDCVVPHGNGIRLFAAHRVAEIVEMLRASSRQ